MKLPLRAGFFRAFLPFLLVVGAVADSPAASVGAQLTTAEKQQLQREARLVVDLLQNHHFSGRAFREMESRAMVGRFLAELDPRAEYLDAADLAYLHRRFDRTLKSVYLFRGDLQPAFEMFDHFAQRAGERLAWVQQRLARGFDFTEQEEYVERLTPAPFNDRAEADRHWELLLKEHTLVEMLRHRTYAEAIAEVKRRFHRVDRAIAAYDSMAVRERFFDAIIRSFDPHSGYFSADSTREFAADMEKSVVGLGLILRKEDGRCVVEAVQAGGPADLAGEIHPGDIISAMAAGDTSEWTGLSKLRLREIVALLRGQPGTKLRLAYQRNTDDTRRETTLERNRVALGGDRTHGAVSEVPSAGGTRRIGWIYLPDFYASGEDASVSSATRDVRELLDQMDLSRLDGLVMDLRTNPGGALTEAVSLSELFLPGGLMMLSRGMDGKITEHRLKSGPPVYDGPLVVLVSAGSASASEVFAGAMKHHRRALIVGSPHTFGKGTVQSYVELAKLPAAGGADWGTLRLTRERFYLPDGGSVQRSGVASHLALPGGMAAAGQTRETDLPGALPEESVVPPAGPAPVMPAGTLLAEPVLAQLQSEVTRHGQELPEWELMHQLERLERGRDPAEPRSLHLETRRLVWQQHADATHDWTRQRQTLTAGAAYPTIALETKQSEAVQIAEDSRLRAGESEGTHLRHRLHQGSFVVETTGGRLRKLRLAAFDFHRHPSEIPALASKLSSDLNLPLDPPALERFLAQAELLDHPRVDDLLRLAGDLIGPEAGPSRAREALELLLKHLVLLDDFLRQERPALDVPLREAQRLAASWADKISEQ